MDTISIDRLELRHEHDGAARQPHQGLRAEIADVLDTDTTTLLHKLKQAHWPTSETRTKFIEELRRLSEAHHAKITNRSLQANLTALTWLSQHKSQSPYSLLFYLTEAVVYQRLCYPDLAAGSAYKALLLADAITDDSDEYHEHAFDALLSSVARTLESTSQKEEAVLQQLNILQADIYIVLATALLDCGCLRSAHQYATQGLKHCPNSTVLERLTSRIETAASSSEQGRAHPSTWPDSGPVRREQYSWDDTQRDRLEMLDEMNTSMSQCAPKLQVKAVQLPNLVDPSSDKLTVTQLGVFAKEDLQPGEVVLDETSLLTANNRLQDALCDACSADLPELHDAAESGLVSCEDCEVIFCSQKCHDLAQELYHPALCDRDVESIAKDHSPAHGADALYALLLLRTLAMAETQDCHPLTAHGLQYIWGDFNDVDMDSIFNDADPAVKVLTISAFPRTLPFSFEYNIRLPFHMLEKLDVNIFTAEQYDVWVFNTLYAKFRGTASARLSGLGGRTIRGPEVAAVHPMWCLANHSCDPNVSWQWGGDISFRVREQRATWSGKHGTCVMNSPGVCKGHEIFNHYCDIDLPVQERRAWARGALGGDCQCPRCVSESQHAQA